MTRNARRGIVPVMPRQRWRNQVLEELRGSRADIRALGGEVSGLRAEVNGLGAEVKGLGVEIKCLGVEIRGLGDRQETLLHEFREANERALERLAEQNRAAVRDMKASVDRNTEVTDRCADVLSGLAAQIKSSEAKLDELVDQVKAQTGAIFALIDEIRGQNGLSGAR